MDAAARAQALFRAAPTAVQALDTLRANVRVNDKSGDNAGAGQAEASIAVDGGNILIAWNDGQGFDETPSNVQGAAYSSDGGRSFVDVGVPPRGINWTWTSDPVVTVNEKTHTFYYCALFDSLGSAFNGIGVVPATFSGGALVWGTPRAARIAQSAVTILDKEWMVADSSNGTLHLIYTNFNNTSGSEINYQRSLNGGVTWTAASKRNSPASNGLVHGARVAVDRTGAVYAIWSRIGPVDVDFFDVTKSTTAGASFGPVFSAPSYYGNFGSGAPGFNRERGITFPAVAVDRNPGPNANRLYLTWNECINFYDDIGGGAGAVTEIEPNGTTGQATLFTPGNTLRGAISFVDPGGAGSDLDYFRFTGTAGQTLVFSLDSLNAGLDLAWRLLCSDGTTRLAISNLGVGSQAFIVFTLPTSGTYYLRPAPFSTSSTGGYRIRTAVSIPGPERARDHRDVFVASTLNGSAWTTPVRVNQDAGLYDNWLPEVAVGLNPITAQGEPYVIWYDWRDTPAANCGGWSHVYLARSPDGGASWTETARVSEVQTNWTTTLSNIAPNQGDYLALFADNLAVYPVWADGRLGDVDIFASTIPLAVTPTTVALVNASATAERVTLEWYAAGAGGTPATVYRRMPGGAWQSLASATVDGLGHVRYEDRAVRPGDIFDYRLGLMEAGAETFSGETRIEVPLRDELTLEGARPNPAQGEMWVSLSLARDARATLRLLDIGGRQIREQEVGSMGPGHHLIRFAGGAPLPAGVYVLTLTQGERTVSRRVTVVR